MTTAAVIVAAGRGTRVGGNVPKQWRMLAGRTIASRTLEVFQTCPQIDRVVLVVHSGDMEIGRSHGETTGAVVVAGGATRAASVHAGLEALAQTGTQRVLIHDAARPLVDHALIARVCDALEQAEGAAPAVAVSDALWRGDQGRVAGVVDRSGVYRAQTPQGFDFASILAAHRARLTDTADDVELARDAGIDVAIVTGDARNLKITTELDFGRAERIMANGIQDLRVGNGFDVHRFGPGDHVVLCGVRLAHDQGLSGHSDADVGMHALADAIYGALAEGDIGQHFPPDDKKWKDADSRVFLDHAAGLVQKSGFTISNVDVTLICEHPKIGPHAPAMRGRLAEILKIPVERVSVKATTTEKLGFTGRGEGIAANATAALVKS